MGAAWTAYGRRMGSAWRRMASISAAWAAHARGVGSVLVAGLRSAHAPKQRRPGRLPPCRRHQSPSPSAPPASQGWTDHHIAHRLVPLYPRLLANDVDRDMAPVVAELEAAGCRGEQLRLIAWEVPKIFSRHRYRRYLRQFQALGVYGLSRTGSGSNARMIAASMMLHPFG